MMRAPSPLSTDPVHLAPTDPTLIAGPDGTWWMFYTQRRAREPDGGTRWVHGTDIGVAQSVDGGLTWTYGGVVAGLDPHPGRNVFRVGEYYWMITGEWRGQAVYRSTDLTTWEPAGRILDEPGSRSLDRGVGHHADVVVGRDEQGLEVGWIFYFTHRTFATSDQHRVDNGVDPRRLTDIHVAVLRADADRLGCDRDAPVALDLRRTV
ncbi:hypothetical protein ACIBL3_10610 [Kribbella sp. NPDC050124]|uniref:hypothetical protein n=1 Tax=Kribbella sp. NPDC050124 TaxID=3364114 RepID=UPI0037ADCE01